MQVAWSENARLDYHENIDYLLKEWSVESASNFIEEVDVVLDLIKINPNLYPESDHKSVRRAVIRKQITLFYQVKGSTIYLVRFWNSHKDPESFEV